MLIDPIKGNEFALISLVLAVYIFSYEKGPISKFLKLQPIVYIGSISYSIYLIHFPLMVALRFPEHCLQWLSPAEFEVYRGIWIDKIIYVAILIYLSHISYKYIETPSRIAIQSILDKRRAAAAT